MEDFEHKVIELPTYKPKCWYGYVDDTFVVWPHGMNKGMEFSELLSVIYNTDFTMETEKNGHLPFLDTDILRKSNGSLGHMSTVYHKPTQTNLYLNSTSYHHPSNKHAVLNTLLHRVRSICDSEGIHEELQFLTNIFKDNGYSHRQIHAVNPAYNKLKVKEKSNVALLPHIHITFNRQQIIGQVQHQMCWNSTS
jgi:hypothetical protein